MFLGPFANAPIDTIKTRIQRSSSQEKGWSRFKTVTVELVRKEGYLALYKGLLPRLMRVGVGQAVTFASYEKIKILIDVVSRKGLIGVIEDFI
jgi:solute carrier family 25 citrate transporter 1